jgi:hypothetical protein
MKIMKVISILILIMFIHYIKNNKENICKKLITPERFLENSIKILFEKHKRNSNYTKLPPTWILQEAK